MTEYNIAKAESVNGKHQEFTLINNIGKGKVLLERRGSNIGA